MPQSNERLNNAQVSHAIYLQRVYSGITNDFDPYLKRTEKKIREILLQSDFIIGKAQISKVVKRIEKEVGIVYNDWIAVLMSKYSSLSSKEIDFQYRIHNAEKNSLGLRTTFNEADLEKAISNYESQPVIVDNKALEFEEMNQQWKQQEISRITQTVIAGAAIGISTSLIMKEIRGTKENSFRDGQLNVTRNNNSAIVKTQAAHVSQVSKETFYSANRRVIIGYEIVATLDTRTSTICKSYDGQIILRTSKRQPRPPFHYNCRTVTSAVFSDESGMGAGGKRAARGPEDGTEVAGDITYYDWLKRQPAWFQDEALGPNRGKIFRNAGLTPEEFRKASVNAFNRPLTIEQMANKDKKIAKYLESKEG